ncbi:MAG: hypothetical protein FJX76_08490 [Armatimonadetes bacterium]|nr:hypothetical protein [Armatimonadota bacterium]
MILVYTDPKKRLLQMIEIALLIIALPFAAVYGMKSYKIYQAVVESERLFEVAENLAHAEDYKASVVALEECLAVNPRYFPAYEAMADLYFIEHRRFGLTREQGLSKAIALLEKGMIAAGDDPRMPMELSEFYMTTGKPENLKKAEAIMLAAVKMAPTNHACQTMLKMVRNQMANGSTARS